MQVTISSKSQQPFPHSTCSCSSIIIIIFFTISTIDDLLQLHPLTNTNINFTTTTITTIMLQSLLLHPPTTMNTNTSKRTINNSAGENNELSGYSDSDDSHPHNHKRRNVEDDHSIEAVESSSLRLLGLLLKCAECVAIDNLHHANNLLPEITNLSSPFGSSPQRVAAYFAEALQSRIISSYIKTYTPLTFNTNIKTLALTQNQKICTALQSYNSISPSIKFSHFTANQAIFQALEHEETVHIIDLDIMQGLQWPGLFHILASRSRKIKSLRITGVGSSMKLLIATGRRLHDFAHSLGLPFEFVPLEGKIGSICSDLNNINNNKTDLNYNVNNNSTHLNNINDNSTDLNNNLNNNWNNNNLDYNITYLNNLNNLNNNSSGYSDLNNNTNNKNLNNNNLNNNDMNNNNMNNNDINNNNMNNNMNNNDVNNDDLNNLMNKLGVRSGEPVVVHWMHHCLYDVTGSDIETLRLLKILKPRLITIIEQDLSHGGSFLNRFVEALHYYSALFDAVGDGIEADNMERYMVEQQLFGCEIKNIVAVGGPKRTGEVKVERWGKELGRVGFRPVSLSGKPASQAGLLLGMFPWRGYTLVEENGCLKLGWKDLCLLTASAWKPLDC